MTMKSMPMKSAEIRDKFLKFFESKGHQIVASSSLVPHADPTLLFTNAGMNQFKDVFLGFDKRPYLRATTSQKCVRAGGKHNDLENVGYTARHHTFFEMLGNFSFGDYFKLDAIRYAWELLVDVYGLAARSPVGHRVRRGRRSLRHLDAGDRCAGRAGGAHRRQQGRPLRFRQLLDDGRHRSLRSVHGDLLRSRRGIPGGPPGSPDEDGDRYIEIWNNVFMQFNRDEAGVMHPLPKPSVDTGMGLERTAAVLQHVHSNYEIDLFVRLIAAAARETSAAELDSPSLRVLADHIRACAFLISDGVIPGNEGRGYVLRRIIRRAIRHGYKLGARAAFFHRLVPDLVAEMGAAYPELVSNEARVSEVLRQEEVRFFETIEHGMSILESELAALPGQGRVQRRHGVQAARHLRFPARPDGRCLPRARGERRRRRFRLRRWRSRRSRRALPASSGWRCARVRRPADELPWLRERSSTAARCSRCTVTAARSMQLRGRRHRASWFSTRRRSTPSPAGRSATAACCRRRARHLRRRGYAEDPGRGFRPPGSRPNRRAQGR
jgi:alanyl-tRNA synthetase